ncbi:MAG TPA: methyl-accepting chemotaxis protein [Nitrospiria bacterium]|nr:methyl-accepting chemotaxis protein [Nitrospiria bacterium]
MFKISIQIKFCILVAFLLILLNSFITVFVLRQEERIIREGMESKAKATALSLSLTGAKVVLDNLFLIQDSLKNFSKFPDVSEIYFVDETRMISASRDISRIGESVANDPLFDKAVAKKEEILQYASDKNGNEILILIEPMVLEGKTTGWIRLELSLASMRERMAEMKNRMIFLAVGIIFLGTVLVYLFSRKITGGLKILVRQLKLLSEGDFSKKLTLKSRDELGDVANSSNLLVDQMSRVLHKLQASAQKLSEISQEVFKGARLIEQGAETTLVGSSETSQFLESLNHSVKQVEKEIIQLTIGIEKNATSVIEVGQTTKVVAENMETLSNSITQTISSIGQISTGVKDINRNTDILSKAALNTAEETRVLDGIIQNVGQSIESTQSLSQESLAHAQRGVEDVRSTLEGILKIKENGLETGNVMQSLGEKTQQIGKILTVINNIAEETNLLALNAAIISSQAGEHGKGFAVVASEIKDLADRTVISTREIKELIRVLQEESVHAADLVKGGNQVIEAGVQKANQASEALNNIIKSAHDSSEMINHITSAVTSQAAASKRISEETGKIANEAMRIFGITQEQEKETSQVVSASSLMKEVSTQVKNYTVENSKETTHVTDKMEEIRKMINFVKSAMVELSSGSTNILNAAQNIKKVSSENLELVKSREGYAKDLATQSEDLLKITSYFKITK